MTSARTSDDAALRRSETEGPFVDFQTAPERYCHWSFDIDGRVANLKLDVQEDAPLRDGYALKLNSYDLGVDIELHDALQRLRFEHPEVAAVVLTSGKERMFCAGANIFMLGQSSHAWKVNFCKFTNETRNSMEDSSRHSGIKFVAALNGITAGGGYELAMACDEIYLVDDRTAAVSLPEVPLLGVLPGTGGLTRLIDKRKVRRDLADIFCTNPDGIKGKRAKEWGLVDDVFPPSDFDKKVFARAAALAADSDRPGDAKGIALTPLNRTIDDKGYHYDWVDVAIDREQRLATITVRGCPADAARDIEGALAAGADWWPLALGRELDDAILTLRSNELEIGTFVFKTEGAPDAVLAMDSFLFENTDHWFVREVVGLLRRTLARLEVTSRSMFALIEPGSCFAGTLYELALAADRAYMLDLPEEEGTPAHVSLSALNFGPLPMVNGCSRLAARFNGDDTILKMLEKRAGEAIGAADAAALGLVTVAPDDLDWDDEIRLLLEERASLSPDALTGMEANLRFPGPETMETRIFGRLTAWQNWIFNRPNAVGDHGALTVFGTGTKADYDWKRV